MGCCRSISLCACGSKTENASNEVEKTITETDWVCLPYKYKSSPNQIGYSYETYPEIMRFRDDGTGDKNHAGFDWEIDENIVRYTLKSNGNVFDLELVETDETYILVRDDNYQYVYVPENEYDLCVSKKMYTEYGAAYEE